MESVSDAQRKRTAVTLPLLQQGTSPSATTAPPSDHLSSPVGTPIVTAPASAHILGDLQIWLAKIAENRRLRRRTSMICFVFFLFFLDLGRKASLHERSSSGTQPDPIQVWFFLFFPSLSIWVGNDDGHVFPSDRLYSPDPPGASPAGPAGELNFLVNEEKVMKVGLIEQIKWRFLSRSHTRQSEKLKRTEMERIRTVRSSFREILKR
ncbi:hypothetical protein U1Q18_038365 [Sarracenia purpurea var. burkii]